MYDYVGETLGVWVFGINNNTNDKFGMPKFPRDTVSLI
jgi:hypothetical protein